MNEDDKKKKRLKRAAIVLISIALAFIFILLAVRGGEKMAFSSFYANAKMEFATPGVNSGFVGQGFDYVEDGDIFLACGYSAKKGKLSMVYAIDGDGKMKKADLINADGSAYTGHTGGIAHYGDYVYITGSDGCDVFTLSDVLDGGDAVCVGQIKCPKGHDPAFVTVYGDKLYEGSFYRSGNYETPDCERITTDAGDENKAVIYVYNLDESKPFGVDETPVAAYSTRGLVQGMCFTESHIVLSTSYGLAASHLYYYNLDEITAKSASIGGLDNLTVSYLESSCIDEEASFTAPPMSEEIVYRNGRIYIMTESASNKYIFGKFMSGRYIYSYKMA